MIPQQYPLMHQLDPRKLPPNNNNNIQPHLPILNPNMNGKVGSQSTPGAFGNSTPTQYPPNIGPLQLQQHHFQQQQQQNHNAQMLQKTHENNHGPPRHLQDTANNNPERASVTSSIHSASVQSNNHQQGHQQPPGVNGNKQEQRLTHEQFRAALQLVVSPGDPRENLENFIKIGEGSTGTVWIAMEKNTSK
jgi:p21-activated kinase 5